MIKQLPALNVVNIYSPHESMSEKKDKSGPIASNPEPLPSADYYFEIYGIVSSFLSFIRRKIALLPNLLAK